MQWNRRIDELGRVSIPPKAWNKKAKGIVRYEMTIEYGEIYVREYDEGDISKKPYVGIVRKAEMWCHRISIPVEYTEILGIERGEHVLLTLEDDGRVRITKLNK